jgi:hypothetical protein
MAKRSVAILVANTSCKVKKKKRHEPDYSLMPFRTLTLIQRDYFAAGAAWPVQLSLQPVLQLSLRPSSW